MFTHDAPCLAQVDGALTDSVVILKVDDLPGHRLVFAPTGPLNRDYDDVRRFSDAAEKGIKRSAVQHVTFKPGVSSLTQKASV